ncbi:hypothetical protein A2U01_0042576, partial [Trifolium medium]|nr:hypothetical protein [Trifolium medium]
FWILLAIVVFLAIQGYNYGGLGAGLLLPVLSCWINILFLHLLV